MLFKYFILFEYYINILLLKYLYNLYNLYNK